MKKTFKELKKLNGTYIDLVKEHPSINNTKFGYAWNKFFNKNLEPIFKEYNSILIGLSAENGLTDKETGEILMTNMGRGFKFSKEGFKKLIEAENKLEEEWNSKEYEIEPYFTSDIPKDLNFIQLEEFEGFIIKSSDASAS